MPFADEDSSPLEFQFRIPREVGISRERGGGEGERWLSSNYHPRSATPRSRHHSPKLFSAASSSSSERKFSFRRKRRVAIWNGVTVAFFLIMNWRMFFISKIGFFAARRQTSPQLCRIASAAFLPSEGKCPLTPEESVLMLAALGFNHKTSVYICRCRNLWREVKNGCFKKFPHLKLNRSLIFHLS